MHIYIALVDAVLYRMYIYVQIIPNKSNECSDICLPMTKVTLPLVYSHVLNADKPRPVDQVIDNSYCYLTQSETFQQFRKQCYANRVLQSPMRTAIT